MKTQTYSTNSARAWHKLDLRTEAHNTATGVIVRSSLGTERPSVFVPGEQLSHYWRIEYEPASTDESGEAIPEQVTFTRVVTLTTLHPDQFKPYLHDSASQYAQTVANLRTYGWRRSSLSADTPLPTVEEIIARAESDA